jgi:protein gp37
MYDPDFEKLKAGTKIFVCSVSDLFAEWTKPEWRDAVLDKIRDPKYDDLIFQMLTKSPEGIPDDSTFPHNTWIGVTVTNQPEVDKIIQLAFVPTEGKRFASFEPLLGPIILDLNSLSQLDWIIIGKLTGSRKVPLQKEWVQSLVDQARSRRIPIFIKDNVGWATRIQEFPHGE